MSKHLLISLMSYLYLGFGVGVELFGIKAGIGFYPCIAIYSSSMIVFLVVAFTSLQKLKVFIKENENKEIIPAITDKHQDQ